MNLDFLANFSVPVIVGICLCVGYILKNAVPTDKINRFIPLVMSVIGLGLNIWINMSVSPEIILGGIFSGLSSTGLYEMFRNLLHNKEGK